MNWNSSFKTLVDNFIKELVERVVVKHQIVG